MQGGAIAAVIHRQHHLASVLFVLALNHKHMLLFFAPAFFSTLFGAAFSHPSAAAPPGTVTAGRGVARVVALGVTVIGTMAAVWAPFLARPGTASQVRVP